MHFLKAAVTRRFIFPSPYRSLFLLEPLSCCLCVIIMLFFLSACGGPEPRPRTRPGQPRPYKIGKNWYQPIKHAQGFRQRGIASWYGKDFHGRRTANGEIYNMYAMTAAHKTLPLGTYVKVTNLRNDKTVVVRINDRGPFIRGRVIDMSYASAKKLGLVGPGTAPVEVVALGKREKTTTGAVKQTYVPVNYYEGNFSVQVGAYQEKSNALRVKEKLDEKYQAHIVVYESSRGTFYRVRAAKCRTLDEARRYEKMLEADGYTDAMVVAE
jgi:rare lipoprotein A